MGNPYWPLFDLRISTPVVEIRYPSDEILVQLARVAADGIHDPETMPFSISWTDVPSPQMERNTLQYMWSKRASWYPADWEFTGAVIVNGQPAGIQTVFAKDFAVTRTVETGSWLGRSYQGRGIGTEMRAAILHFAFEGLGALEAHSGAFEDNPTSHAVSRSSGYVENGRRWFNRRGTPGRMILLRLDRNTWESRRREDIQIEGLGDCRPWFGIDEDAPLWQVPQR
jgi:RimJ/RimL family protein N-acetyltransferase